ncbi:MAG: hypothetical protein AAGA17_01420 [Actinomycetota bacterium]
MTIEVRDPGGELSAEELAAVVAAVEVAWPRPVAAPPPPDRPPAWRFSGRWWRVAPRSWPISSFPVRARPT